MFDVAMPLFIQWFQPTTLMEQKVLWRDLRRNVGKPLIQPNPVLLFMSQSRSFDNTWIICQVKIKYFPNTTTITQNSNWNQSRGDDKPTDMSPHRATDGGPSTQIPFGP